MFDSAVDKDNNDSNDLWRCCFNCLFRVSARKKNWITRLSLDNGTFSSRRNSDSAFKTRPTFVVKVSSICMRIKKNYFHINGFLALKQRLGEIRSHIFLARGHRMHDLTYDLVR